MKSKKNTNWDESNILHHFKWMEITQLIYFSSPFYAPVYGFFDSVMCVCKRFLIAHSHFHLVSWICRFILKNIQFSLLKSILPNVIIFVSSHSKPIIKFYIITVFKSWIGIVQASYRTPCALYSRFCSHFPALLYIFCCYQMLLWITMRHVVQSKYWFIVSMCYVCLHVHPYLATGFLGCASLSISFALIIRPPYGIFHTDSVSSAFLSLIIKSFRN